MYQHNFGVNVARVFDWADSNATFPAFEHPWMDEEVKVRATLKEAADLDAWNAKVLKWERDNLMTIQLVEMDLIIPVGPRIADWKLSALDPTLGWELWNIVPSN